MTTPIAETYPLLMDDRYDNSWYDERARALRELATMSDALEFGTWSEYLKSDLWFFIKNWIKDRDDHRCQICDRRDRLVVHHRSYSRSVLAGFQDSQLITLCNPCHDTISGDLNEPALGRRSFGMKHTEELLQASLAAGRPINTIGSSLITRGAHPWPSSPSDSPPPVASPS